LAAAWLATSPVAERRTPQKIGALASRNKAANDVIMGIRPEDVSVDEFGEVHTEVYMIEPLGRGSLVTLNISEHVQIQSLVPTTTKVKIGEQIKVHLNLNKLHFFDPSTEQSVLL
jgi:multiple sugar transport system ATP-binding protein